jgi:hypothetical protein
MTPKYLERTKRTVAIILTVVCLLGCVVSYTTQAHPEDPRIRPGDILLLLAAGAAFFSGMPGDFDNLREKKIWAIAGFCTLPVIAVIWVLKPWVVFTTVHQ